MRAGCGSIRAMASPSRRCRARSRSARMPSAATLRWSFPTRAGTRARPPAVRCRPGGPRFMPALRWWPRTDPASAPSAAGQPPRRLSRQQREPLEDLQAWRSISWSCVARAGARPGGGRGERSVASSPRRSRACLRVLLCDADGRCLLQSGKSIAHWGDQIGKLPHESRSGRRACPLADHVAADGETVRTESSYTSAGATSTSRRSLRAARPRRADLRPVIHVDITARKRAEALRRRARRGSRRRSRACPSTSGSATPSAVT